MFRWWHEPRNNCHHSSTLLLSDENPLPLGPSHVDPADLIITLRCSTRIHQPQQPQRWARVCRACLEATPVVLPGRKGLRLLGYLLQGCESPLVSADLYDTVHVRANSLAALAHLVPFRNSTVPSSTSTLGESRLFASSRASERQPGVADAEWCAPTQSGDGRCALRSTRIIASSLTVGAMGLGCGRGAKNLGAAIGCRWRAHGGARPSISPGSFLRDFCNREY